ncbi:hypothetical protein L3Y34_009809 [Caenorhabditis briggsae]|uniref:L-Fucosyltransferase n=1 Tax=Caenorhabditis briggsae TaxID=6238 RepID=A0AAE9A3I1_CAEBR|nr:hypothetical protein L3Y34_009809 [Caenorhabditis briggsae]
MHCMWSPKSKLVILIAVSLIISIIFITWCILPYDYSNIPRTTHCDNILKNETKYLLFPMFTIISGSGLGNQLFEIFSLLGMAEKMNRTAIFNKRDWFLNFRLKNVREKIPKIAENVRSMDIEPSNSMRYINSPACCEYNFPHVLYCEQSKFVVIDGRYFQSFKYFENFESEIRGFFVPSGSEMVEVDSMISFDDLSKFKNCVHIRRGDFVTDGQHAGSDPEFTRNAIEYIYEKNPGPIFIFSNEQNWVKQEISKKSKLKNEIRIMPTPKEKPFKDLYFSQKYCNSVLITAPSSTFGWWLGYLSKNQTNVYFRDIREVEDSVKYQMIDDDFFPAKWNKLGMMSNNGTIFLKKNV